MCCVSCLELKKTEKSVKHYNIINKNNVKHLKYTVLNVVKQRITSLNSVKHYNNNVERLKCLLLKQDIIAILF